MSSISPKKSANILLQLAPGIEGATWRQQRNGWDKNTYVCLWEGITCDSQDDIISINLSNTNLIGTIPKSLAYLTSLQHLYLSENKIHGTIPPLLLTALPNLRSLDLYKNTLRGPIPPISNPNLEVVNLGHNQFSDVLPEGWGERLTRLRVLDVGHNMIGGTLPMSLGGLIELEMLNLSHNKIHGTIPETLGASLKLEGLFLNDNNLVGRVPTSLTRDFLALREVFLHNNHLSGTIPLSMADLQHLEILSLDGNKITGTIPTELCDKQLNDVVFRNTDTASNAKLKNSKTTHKSTANSDSSSCPSIACPAESTKKANNVGSSCKKCGTGHKNPYIGGDHCYNVDRSHILKIFFNATDGVNWAAGGDTWLDDDIPVCDKYGIRCDSAGDIVEINLSNMNLSGKIPEELGFLRHVKTLDLSRNHLYGNLPSELRFLPLETFDVAGNLLTGLVPPELCRKNGINGNGKNGDLNCDNIACAMGSYSKIGRAEGEFRCLPCNNEFLGSQSCWKLYSSRSDGSTTSSSSDGYALFLIFLVTISVFSLLYIAILSIFQGRNDEKTERKSSIVEFDHIDDQSITSDLTGHADAAPALGGSELGIEAFSESLNKPSWSQGNKTSGKDMWLDVPQFS